MTMKITNKYAKLLTAKINEEDEKQIVDENVVSFKRVREKSLCLVVFVGNYFRIPVF